MDRRQPLQPCCDLVPAQSSRWSSGVWISRNVVPLGGSFLPCTDLYSSAWISSTACSRCLAWARRKFEADCCQPRGATPRPQWRDRIGFDDRVGDHDWGSGDGSELSPDGGTVGQ